MVKNTITLGHLYPKQMNVYGDMGNIITLRYRLEQRGYIVKYIAIDSLKEVSSEKIDILIGGGGQDSNQMLVQADLQMYKPELKDQIDAGLVALMICGMYQLLGNRFILSNNSEIPGVGIIDAETRAGEDRLIGNVVIKSPFGRLVGFENHSGRTYLAPGVTSLGLVIKGAGNNGETGEEGAVVNNLFASYLHGPILAKNPGLADELIDRALTRRFGKTVIPPLDDFLELEAAAFAMKRPR